MKAVDTEKRDRILYNRNLYSRVGEKSFHGPQGKELSVFIQEACPLREVVEANLDKFSSRGTSNKKYASLFSIKSHYDAPESTSRQKHIHSMTDILQLTAEGIRKLEDPFLASTKVYCIEYRCPGGGIGNSSGSNCRRVPSRYQWCNGVGSCEEHCAWLLLPEKERNHTRLQHMCDFTVTIEATLSDISEDRRRITISGDHGYSDPADWKSATTQRPAEHFKQNTVRLGSVLAGLSRSNVLDALNSPSGKVDSRSCMTRNEYGRSIEYHKHGE
jgi:hypothetical protein